MNSSSGFILCLAPTLRATPLITAANSDAPQNSPRRSAAGGVLVTAHRGVFICVLRERVAFCARGCHDSFQAKQAGGIARGLHGRAVELSSVPNEEQRPRDGVFAILQTPLRIAVCFAAFCPWCHDRRTLPPYLLLRVRQRGKAISYELRFNVVTLEMVAALKVLRVSDSMTSYRAIKVPSAQKEEIHKSIRKLR